MSRGKRYDTEPKLNMKKVFAVIIAIIVIIMFVIIIKGLLTKDTITGKISSKSYFTAYKDNKWGVIDSDGNTVIDPSYKEMIVVPNSKKGVFICTYDTNYENGEYKTKALNEKNEEIFTQYDKIEAMQNIDKTGNLIYDTDILKVEKDGKYGLLTFDGKEKTSIEYEEINAISGIDNSFKVKKDGKYGCVDKNGKVVVDYIYDDGTEQNSYGFVSVKKDGLWGSIDKNGKTVIEPKYNLENNIKIDFIGKWHLGEDLSMNYYCEK